MEKEFKLEVGKSYIVRYPVRVKEDGTDVIVRITSRNNGEGSNIYPFIGDDDCLYMEDGSFDIDCNLSPYDLVKEVI